MRESERYNEYELVYMILQGDEHSLQLLLHQYQPKINAIIKQNCTYQVMIRHHEGDLHQVAAAALMRAVLEYREEKGISFSTFSGKVIRNAVIDYQRSLYRKDFSLTHEVLHLDAAIHAEGTIVLLDLIESQQSRKTARFRFIASRWRCRRKSCARASASWNIRYSVSGVRDTAIARSHSA